MTGQIRRFLLSILATALLPAAPLAAQLAFETSSGTPELPEPAEKPADPAPPARTFGYSNAVNVLLTRPASPMNPDVLAGLGGGWELGHRWIRLAQDEPAGLPGVPVGLPGEPVGLPGVPVLPTAGPAPLPDGADDLPGVPVVPTAGPAPLLEDADNLPGVPVGAPAESRVEVRPVDVTTPDEPGVWLLESGSGTSVTVITQVPASRVVGGRLNGYHIGYYPTAGSGRADAYAPPDAFIEVTPANRDLPVSKHLTLAQFITKDQVSVWPKYVALDSRLLDKLELVMQELNAMGVRAERLYVMSGFRTPQYNGPGGDGRAALSRHMWGDAADVWVDNDGDGEMDDLNGDGTIDTGDAAVMLRAVDRIERRFPELVGGAGVYPATSAHGPFIHIDARGHHSRW